MRAGTLTNRFAWPIAAVIALPGHTLAQEACPALYSLYGEADDDLLGWSVSRLGDLNGDGSDDFLVGAPGHDSPAGESRGKVSVFSGATGEVLRFWYGEQGWSTFGGAVSGAGDVNGDGTPDILVGAAAYDGPAGWQSGKAYVYSGAAGELLWSWDAEGEYHFLGQSVSGAGDVDADGFPDVIVGAPGFGSPDNGFPGRAYVYSGATGALLWWWEGEVDGDRYGRSVSGAGDFNGDGFDDLIVGAYWADGPAGVFAGKAYVYSGATGQLLSLLNGYELDEEFGISVSGAGDVNGDGFDDVVVGAWFADGDGAPGSDQGKAYVFGGPSGELLWSWQGELYDVFGYSVSGAGDVNGDQVPDVIVGAYGHSPPGGWGNGKASVFSGATGELLWSATGEGSLDSFGHSVSGAGDVNGDGFADVIVGAPFHNGPGATYYNGAAYVYRPFTFADCDCDGRADLTDYAVFGMCIRGPGEGFAPPECACADFDGDDDVDLVDLAALQSGFTGSE